MLLLQQSDQLWTIIAYCNVGLTVIQPKPLALRDGSNWKRKLSCHFGNPGREWGKEMLKKLQ